MAEPIAFLPPAGSRIAVLGACGGIGADVVRALVDGGCMVIAMDLPKSLAEAPSPAHHAVAFDGRDPASIKAAFAQVADIAPELDGLVIASGFAGPRQPIDQWGIGQIDDVLDGNLRLMTLCLRAAVPLLRHGRPASVVMLTSDMAYIPQAGYAPYVAAKAGMVAMGQSVARELAPSVRINFVSPGAVDTPFLRGGRGRSTDPTAPLRFDMAAYLAQVPLARMATAADVTGPILFLLGPASDYMTGTVLHVSGGAFMG
jgi:3-oxoacyl-[acyl-carrier protein] reductase